GAPAEPVAPPDDPILAAIGTRVRNVGTVGPVDVMVVGAGPAGVAAGIEARSRGLDVCVVDKASFPRDKTCGDGLTAGALRALEALGLSYDAFAAIDAAIVHETVLVSPSGRRVTLPLPTDGLHAVVIARRDLDAALVALAR